MTLDDITLVSVVDCPDEPVLFPNQLWTDQGCTGSVPGEVQDSSPSCYFACNYDEGGQTYWNGEDWVDYNMKRRDGGCQVYLPYNNTQQQVKFLDFYKSGQPYFDTYNGTCTSNTSGVIISTWFGINTSERPFGLNISLADSPDHQWCGNLSLSLTCPIQAILTENDTIYHNEMKIDGITLMT